MVDLDYLFADSYDVEGDMPDLTGRPMYLVVADDLRKRIDRADLRPGDQIPSLAELVGEYDASTTTIRQALAVLRAEGHLVGQQGKGVFVRRARASRERLVGHLYEGRPVGSPMARLVESFGSTPSWEHSSLPKSATAEVARRLSIKRGEAVMVTQHRFFADDEPVLISTSYEPLSITGGTAIEYPEVGEPRGVVARFDSIGVRVENVVERVSARAPRPYEVEALVIPTGVPVMCIERTYNAGPLTVETADLVVAGDNYTLTYVVPLPENERGEDNAI